jgi:hypothetical protein
MSEVQEYPYGQFGRCEWGTSECAGVGRYRPDPYVRELYEEEDWRFMCDGCFGSRADAI